VILTVLIAEFELRGFTGTQGAFFGVELLLGREIAGAFVVGTFVDGHDLGALPQIQSAAAVWAPVLGFGVWLVVISYLGEAVAEFAA